MALIRATSLQGYAELVRLRGGDPDSLLRAVKIAPALAGRFEAFLGHRNVIAAIETAAAVINTPDFGRMLAQRQGIEILGPVGAAARSARTVAEALAAFRDYVSVYSPSLRIEVVDHIDPRFAIVELRITLEPSPPELRQTTELTLGVTRRILELVVGPTFRPVTVHIPHDPLTPPAEYVAYFGSAVKFRESFCGITVRRSDLDKSIAGDSSAHEALRAYLNSIAQPGISTEIEAVQLIARHLLPTGLTIKLVAQHLGLHPRTLQRRLAAQSTTYEQVVDQTRKELAARLLRDTDMPVSQLAGVLGYSEQSVLVGSTHRWFGSTPTGYRKSVRQGTVAR